MKVKNFYWLILVFVIGFIACGAFPFIIFQSLYTTNLAEKPSEMWYLTLVIISLIYCLGFVVVTYFGEKYFFTANKKK